MFTRRNPDAYRDEAFRAEAAQAYADLTEFLAEGKTSDNRYKATKDVAPRTPWQDPRRGYLRIVDSVGKVEYLFYPKPHMHSSRDEKGSNSKSDETRGEFTPDWTGFQDSVRFFGVQQELPGYRGDFAYMGTLEALAATAEFLRKRESRAVFMHEYTHRLDSMRVDKGPWRLAAQKTRLSDRNYWRDPLEFNARYQQAVADIDAVFQRLPSKTIQKRLESFDAFMTYVKTAYAREDIAEHLGRYDSPLYRHAIKRLHEDYRRLRQQYARYLKRSP